MTINGYAFIRELKNRRKFLLRLGTLLVFLGAGLGCSFQGWLNPSPDRLLARAYGEQRTLELRITGAKHAPLRLNQRVSSSFDRPRSLLEAEARIGRLLQRLPEDTVSLSQRGRTGLLTWTYEAAITDLQHALDSDSKSPEILTDLASAYFERAESEQRFDDYGTAFELQSRALQAQPDNLTTLFNRAITSERLFLFKQCFEDWNHYLRLDPSGAWADEARERLAKVRSGFDAHERRIAEPLLTPAEFVKRVHPNDPRSWEVVEPRIEEYLNVAITEWLVSAFVTHKPSDAPNEAKDVLGILAVILCERHQDRWLTDLLSSLPTPQFKQAVVALSRAIVADTVSEDYELGTEEAHRAATLFSIVGNSAGRMRAQFEETYALRFSDAPRACLDIISRLTPGVERNRYRWLQIQLRLERYNCDTQGGNFERTSQLLSAHTLSMSARYEGLSLRAIGFWAFDEIFKGKSRSGWQLCGQGLRQYWSSATHTMLGYNLYFELALAAQSSQFWHADRAATEQALTIVAALKNPLMRAVESMALAKAALISNEPVVAQEGLRSAQLLLSSAAKTGTTDNYRLTVETYAASLDGLSGNPKAGLARLEQLQPKIARISNTHLLAEFYRTAGELWNLAGDLQEAQTNLMVAVALGEKERRSLRTDVDRIGWAREWSQPYLDLMELEIKGGRVVEALSLWELYRDSRPDLPKILGKDTAHGVIDSASETILLRRALARKSELVNRVSLTLKDKTVLVFALLRSGVAIWAYDDRGIAIRFVQRDPVDLRIQAQRLSDLCRQPSSSLDAVHRSATLLYKELIEPVSNRLRSNQSVIIETDEALAKVPFQALMDASGHYLSDWHPIAYLHDASYLDATTPQEFHPRRISRALIVMTGDGSTQGVGSLEAAATEADRVSHYFTAPRVLAEADASLDRVSSQIKDSEIFHFAGHASSHEGQTGLFLSGDRAKGSYRLFDSERVRAVPIPHLRLVVLSACSTANGPEGTSLDPGSLVQAFLSRGVSHVVASRWDVDSETSSFLMERFYQRLFSGETVSDALADAERLVRKTSEHPYYWAAFDSFGRN